MKFRLAIIAALLLTVPATYAFAQKDLQAETDGQQACEGDVYNLCGDAIPDQDKIVACLRKHWSKVSKECRTVMIHYNKNHKQKKPSTNGLGGFDPARRY